MTDRGATGRRPDARLATDRRSITTAIAVTTHELASTAAVNSMAAGGTAADAMIAANAVVAVVLPDTCGPGGDLFAIVHEPGDGAPAVLNASGRAGSGIDVEAMRGRYGDEMPLRAPETVTVPGCVDGWVALHRRYGAIPLEESMKPAIQLARDGFPVSEELARSLVRLQPLIGDQASARPLYPNGRPPDAGDVITRPRLADTLEAIARSGREAFYAGDVGNAITESTGGVLTADDLARDQADWVEPLHVRAFGLDGWTVPPNSQGYITLAAAAIFEQLAPPTDAEDPAFLHAAIEAYRAAAWDRDDVLADPTTDSEASLPIDRAELARRASMISGGSPAAWPPPPWRPGGTAYYCARDSAGMAVSFIQSNFHGIGSGLAAGDTGVFLHNRGAGFTLAKGHRNELATGKRPLHTLSPTLWTDGDELRLLLGTRGGQYQPQLLLQVAAHHLYIGVPLREAQSRPRWQVDGWAGAATRHTVTLEDRYPPRVRDGLALRGHDVRLAGSWEPGWGPVSAIAVDGNLVDGAADPRISTAAALAAPA